MKDQSIQLPEPFYELTTGDIRYDATGTTVSWVRSLFQTREVLHSFTVITTDPNNMLRQIHNRMPVIYDRPMGKQWLETEINRSLDLDPILCPKPSEEMEAHEVSTFVNAPANHTEMCIASVPGGQVLNGKDFVV